MRIAHLADYRGLEGNVLENFIDKIPSVIDKTLGNNSEADAVKESGGILVNPAAAKYVNDIGQKLVKNSDIRSDFGYKFGLVRDERPNAFALPNGSIYVTLGLLRTLNDESQLANVLGHEVAHVTKRHTMKQIGVNAGSSIGTAALFGLVSAIGSGVLTKEQKQQGKELVNGLLENGYSRENESESDQVGQGLATKSGWSPKGMIEVMKGFQALDKVKPKGVEAYMRSHPYAGDRVKAAEGRLPSLTQEYPKSQDTGEERYKAFLVDVEKTAPPPAAKSGEAGSLTFGPQGLQSRPAFKLDWDVKTIAGIALIGGSALVLLYLLFKGKKGE